MSINKFLLLLIVMAGLASASLGTVRQSECIEIVAPLNSSAINISTLYYPNFTLSISNKEMTKIGNSFNYTYCDTDSLGVYIYTFYDVTNQKSYGNSFEVTYTGDSLTNETAILYLGLIAISILFMVFIIWFIGKLPDKNMQDEEGRLIQVSWLKYLRFPLWGFVYLLVWAILWFSANLSIAYVGGFIGNLLFAISMIMGYAGIVVLIVAGLKLIDNVIKDYNSNKLMKWGVDGP